MRVRMLKRVGAFKRGSHLCNRLVDFAVDPEHPGHEGQHGNSGVLASGPSS
jgi:hypothetical protein